MKKFLFIPFIIIIISCGGNDHNDEEDDNATEDFVYDHRGWQSLMNDSNGTLEYKKTAPFGIDSTNPVAMVNMLNENMKKGWQGKVELLYVKTSNDTVFVRIPEASYLTQQMGSTGATMYMAEVVYNLTELPGVRYVNFDFTEGDHAGPGTYDRESFKDQ